MANNFVVSVAKAIGRNATTGEGIFLGKANISSAFTISTSAEEIHGGIGNPILYVFYHSRAVKITIESATFDKQFIGMNVGQLTQNGYVDTMQHECITLASGVGTVTLTPISDVVIFLNDSTIQTVTPAGKTITVVNGGNTSVDVAYTVSTLVDNITISTSTPPSIIDLTLIGEIRTSAGELSSYIQIRIPSFQVSGNYTLSFAANGVATQSLEGNALAVSTADCTTGDYFARVSYVPVIASVVPITSIVALPTTLVYTAGVAGSQNVVVLGIRGTTNTTITTSASFITSGSRWLAGLHTGVITISASAAVSSISGSVVVSYASGSVTLTDSVNLSIP